MELSFSKLLVPFSLKLILLTGLALPTFQLSPGSTRSRRVMLDTEGDMSKEQWKVTGKFDYISDGAELEDPRFKKLLPSTFPTTSVTKHKGLWLILPSDLDRRVKDTTLRPNTVTFSYRKPSTVSVLSLESVNVKFQASGESVISVFTAGAKTKTLISAMSPDDEWFTFEAGLNGSEFMEIQFTARRELDLILIDRIELSLNDDAVIEVIESSTSSTGLTPDPEIDEDYGLLLVRLTGSRSCSDPRYLVIITLIGLSSFSLLQYYYYS